MSAIPDRKCAHCGKVFTPRDGRQKYCSSHCQHRAWDAAHGVGQFREERKCAHCGKPFVATRPDRKYCCPNCAAAAYRDRNRTKFEPRACLWCGTVFTPTHHAKAQFCSELCRRRAERARWKAKWKAQGVNKYIGGGGDA